MKRKSLKEFTYGVNEELNTLLVEDDTGFVQAVADLYEEMSVTDIENLVKILRYVESLDKIVALYDATRINHKKGVSKIDMQCLVRQVVTTIDEFEIH